MYEEFYGLTERPFRTAPDPDFLYWSDGHLMAFTMLRYALMSGAAITVVTGDVGAGKTTLVRQLLAEVPDDLSVGLISNMQDGRGELLHWVMMALDQPFDAEEPYVTLFKRFQDYVVEAYADGRRVVLIFDEAQNISMKGLEELRMLSNINADKDDLLQLILIGQPQLRDMVNHPDLVQFAQRIGSDFHLEPLNENETRQYVERRLMLAGAAEEIFPPECCAIIHEVTGGVPRLVNILCDLALAYGYAEDRRTIDPDLLQELLVSAKRRGIYRQFSSLTTTPKLVNQSV